MAKGGTTETKVKMPGVIREAAKENIELAKKVGALPYAPYFGGSVAAFTPGQMAGFNQMNQASNAFGMQGQAGQGLPTPQNFGGISAYSTEAPYNAAMAQVDPKILELYNQFFYPANTAANINQPTTPTAPTAPTVTPPSNPYIDRSHPQYYALGGGSRADRR